MATLTAVAAGGNWSSASTWSPAQVPTAADICKITGAMTGTVTIDGTAGSPNLCRSLDCTGATHTLAQGVNAVLNIGDGSGGNLKLVAGMTYTPNYTSVINFVSTTTGITITTAGKTLGSITFNGAGGVWTLQDNLTLDPSGGTLTLTAGALHDNGKTVSALAFSSDNSNTRALTMSGSWTLYNAGTVWDTTTPTGMTLTATGSTIHLVCDNDVMFQGGGLTYGSVIISGATLNPPIIYGANTFANLTYTSVGLSPDSITFGADQTVTTRLTINGFSSPVYRVLVKSDVKGIQRTLTTAANTITYADFQDIAGAGASGWNLSAITGGSGDCGGNSGITFTSPINCYMKTATSVNWSAANWYTTSGGSTHARAPLPQDTAIFDANSITAASVVITLDVPRIGGMDWTGALNTPGFLTTGLDWSVFGSLTFISAMSWGGGLLTFENRGSITFDSGGSNSPLDWVQNGPGGTVNQVADLGGGQYFSLTSGTWANGSYAATIDVLTIDGGTLSVGSGLLTLYGDGTNFGYLTAGTIEMNGNSIALSTSGATLMSMSGGTLNLSGQIGGTGATGAVLTVSGGAINDTGSAGEIVCATINVTGGTSVIRKLTLTDDFSQSDTSYVKITGSATWGGSWTMSGTDFTFTTGGIPTWSLGSLTMVGSSWTFGG